MLGRKGTEEGEKGLYGGWKKMRGRGKKVT
jgi:hypothetical protein